MKEDAHPQIVQGRHWRWLPHTDETTRGIYLDRRYYQKSSAHRWGFAQCLAHVIKLIWYLERRQKISLLLLLNRLLHLLIASHKQEFILMSYSEERAPSSELARSVCGKWTFLRNLPITTFSSPSAAFKNMGNHNTGWHECSKVTAGWN